MPLPHPRFPGLSGAPAPILGAAWMLLSGALFAVMISLVRHASAEMHPFEVAFFRNLFGLLFMAPWLARTRLGGLRTGRLGLYALRALFALAAMLSWFWAISAMPLGDAVALSFTAPLFASVAAALVLGETMGVRRTSALIAGFAGALVILRPGFAEISPAALVVVFSSVCIAASIMTLKILSRSESTAAIVTWMVVFLTPMSLVPAAFVWTWPDARMLLVLVAMGGVATLAQLALTRAYTVTDTTVVLPFDYARLPFVAVIGWFAFGESTDIWTWTGTAVMGSATVYMAHREARLARAGAGPGTVALGPAGAEATPPAPGGGR